MKTWDIAVCIAAIIAIICAIILLMPSFASSQGPNELKLYERDFLIYQNQSLCFRYEGSQNAMIFVNDSQIEKGRCIDIPLGKSAVSIEDEGKQVWFEAEKLRELPGQEENSSITVKGDVSANQYDEIPLNITIRNGLQKGHVFVMTLKIDNTTTKEIPVRIMPNSETSMNVSMRIDSPGKHVITASIDTGETSSVAINAEARFAFFPLILLVFLPWIIFFRCRLEKTWDILAFSAATLVLASSAIGLFTSFYFVPVLMMALTIAALIWALKNKQTRSAIFSKKLLSIHKLKFGEDAKLLVISLAIILAFAAIPWFFFPTVYTPWNVYYERQAADAFYQDKIPIADNLSYEGRYASFPQGYFAAKAAALEMAGMQPGYESMLIFGLLSSILLIISMVYFTRQLGITILPRLIFILTFSLVMFVYVLIAADLMHMLSISLLFFSLAYAIQKKYKSSAAMLAASCITHPFSLILFPIFMLAIFTHYKTKPERKHYYSYIAAAAAFFLLYSRTLLALGVPYENAPGQWGYLITWGLTSIYYDFTIIIVLFVAAIIANIKNKMSLVTAALIILYLTVSYRLNIAVAFAGGLLLAGWAAKSRKLSIAILAIIVISIVPLMSVLAGFNETCGDVFLREQCIRPMEYLSGYSSSNIAIAPLHYGHIMTFLGGMKVVADPYVEYSNNEKLQDVLSYENSWNMTLAGKWHADIAVTEKNVCDADMVYDNGYIKVCWRD